MSIRKRDLTDMNISLADLEKRLATIRIDLQRGNRRVRDDRRRVEAWMISKRRLDVFLSEVLDEIEVRKGGGW